jgi:hypothetical protein
MVSWMLDTRGTYADGNQAQGAIAALQNRAPTPTGWSNRIIGADGKNMNRQDAKSAKETALCVSLSVLPALCVSL